MAIIISKNGKNAKKVEKSTFGREDYLQKYIYDNPDSIPLYDIREDIRLLILIRELPTDSGPVDAFGIDKDGELYLVETKLYKNPDKRLVVAQVLDYGASLWHSYANYDQFIRYIEDKTNKTFNVSLDQRLKDFFNIDEEEISILHDNIKNNLNNGNFKFVVLMDKLHEKLRDLIIFINENSRFDIFAVELEYYQHEEYEIIIPKLFGAEVKKDIGVSTPSPPRRKWDEESFFEDASKNIEAKQLEAMRYLYEYLKNKADAISWGTGGIIGSFGPKFFKISEKTLLTVRSNGRLALNFGWLNDGEITEKYRDKFKELIDQEKILYLPKDYQIRYPEFKVDDWFKKVDKLIKIIDNLIEEI